MGTQFLRRVGSLFDDGANEQQVEHRADDRPKKSGARQLIQCVRPQQQLPLHAARQQALRPQRPEGLVGALGSVVSSQGQCGQGQGQG